MAGSHLLLCSNDMLFSFDISDHSSTALLLKNKENGYKCCAELGMRRGNIHDTVLIDCAGAVVLWLHAGNGVQALATFRDCSSIDSFYMAEEGRAAQRLIDAYKGSNPDDIKQVIKNNSCFQFLDACIGRLAMKLPREDVDKIASDMQNEGEGIQGGDVDDDDDELL